MTTMTTMMMTTMMMTTMMMTILREEDIVSDVAG
jgi:hypothetical protein